MKKLLVTGLLLSSVVSFLTPFSVFAQSYNDGSREEAAETLEEMKVTCCRCSTSQINGFCVKQQLGKGVSCSDVVNSSAFKVIEGEHKDLLAGFACDEKSLIEMECAVLPDNPSPTAPPVQKCIAPPVDLKGLPTLLDPSLLPPEPRAGRLISPQLGVQIGDLEFSDVTTNAQSDKVTVPFLAQYISAVYRYLVGIIAIIAIIMVMYGGFRYMIGSAAGDVKVGKQIIIDAVVGMLLLFAAYRILETVNPALVKPALLNVPKIGRDMYDQSDKETEAKQYGAGPSSKTEFDPLFQAWAACYDINWKILKAIAQIESDLNPNDVTGKYTGLFQFDREGCRDNTKNISSSLVDCTDDFDPETSTAAGAYRFKLALDRIYQSCGQNLPLQDTIRLVYVGHNNGPSVLTHALRKGGCFINPPAGSGQISQLDAVLSFNIDNPEYARKVPLARAKAKWEFGERAYQLLTKMGVKDTKAEAGTAVCPKTTNKRVRPRTYVSS